MNDAVFDNYWHHIPTVSQELSANYLHLTLKLLGNVIINFRHRQVFIETYTPQQIRYA